MALLLLLLLSAGSSGPPPPPLPPPLETGSRSSSWDSRISPSILLMIAILAIIFFLSGLLHLLIRYLLTPSPSLPPDHRDPSSLDATAMQGQLQQLFHLHDSGVDQAFIDALPVFLYRSLTKDPFDCAVCLCEFDPDDRLRLLPDCSHAFHIHCIDTWLLSHSTCPLCRRSLLLLAPDADADDRLPAADPPDGPRAEDPDKDPPPPPPHGRVVEVKLGKFRAQGGEGCSGAAIDGRRCFSMGSFEYVMDESSQLKVAIRRTPAGGKAGGVDKRRRMAMSECDCHSERELGRKEEGASVSRSWLRGLVGRRAPGDAGSRRVGSFRLGSEVDSGSELGGYDGESGYDGNGAVLRRGEEAPSFARRTMLWVMGRTTHHHSQATNRVGTTTIPFPDV